MIFATKVQQIFGTRKIVVDISHKMVQIAPNFTFFEKKCKKIWSYQKKAVPLHPLLTKSIEKKVSLAQLVEQLTLNQWVESSSLSGDTKGHPNGCPFSLL